MCKNPHPDLYAPDASKTRKEKQLAEEGDEITIDKSKVSAKLSQYFQVLIYNPLYE